MNSRSRERLVAAVLQMLGNDPHPGVHGAARWFLKRWELDHLSELRSRDPAADRDWYINGRGQAFAIVRGPLAFSNGLAGE